MIQLFDITYVVSHYGYLGIFVIVFLESGVFPPLPGDSLLFTAGLLVAVLNLNLFFLIFLIFIATFLGGVLGYEIGVNLEKLHRFSFFRKILTHEHIEKTHKFFTQYGKFAVIISRFIPVVRTFVPIVAGIARMEYMSFIKYSLISSALWSIVMTLLGFFLGRVFPQIKDYVSFVIVLIIILSALPLIWEVFKNRRKKN
jgi:membrane-associated protein